MTSLQLIAAGVGILGGGFGIAAFFVSQRANQIAAAGTFPRLSVVSAESIKFSLPAPDSAQYYFCRTDIRIANTGGAATSIIGVDPVGDFNNRGFLPSLKRSAVFNLDLKGNSIWPLLAATVLNRGNLLLLIGPLARAITSSVKVTVLNGPFPYAMAVTSKEGAGLLPTNAQKTRQGKTPPPIRSIEDFRRLLASAPGSANSTASRLFDLLLPASGPIGLPYPIPANAVKDVAIDFEAVFPPGVDLFTPENVSSLARYGLNLHMGYLLKFPDAPALRIAPTLCGPQVPKDNLPAIQQLLKDQGLPTIP